MTRLYPDRGENDLRREDLERERRCKCKIFEDEETLIALLIYTILTRSGDFIDN